MPYRTKRKTKRKPKRRYKRSRWRYPRLSSMSSPSGMPVQKVAKLRYAEKLSLTSTAGVLSEYVYWANGLYDPNYTGTGHQPMGFDQWANLYNHYVVLGSKITIKMAAAGASPECAAAGVYLSDDATSGYTDYGEFLEAKKGSFALMSQDDNRTRTVTSYYSAKKFHNVKDVKDNRSTIGALVGASPSESAMFHVWYQTQNSATDTIRFFVIIDYIVSFSEPKDLAQS